MKDIIDWLNDPKDYNQGLHLYKIHGGYTSVVTMLRNHKHHEKLITVLRELKNKQPATHPAAQPATAATTATSTYIDQLNKEWHPIYAEMSMYHARMAVVQTDHERKVLAKQVIELEKQCAIHWQQRDYFIEHGQSMPVTIPIARKAVKSGTLSANDHKRLTNLRANVSINKRELLNIEAHLLTANNDTERKQWEVKKEKKVAQMAEKRAEIKKLETHETAT